MIPGSTFYWFGKAWGNILNVRTVPYLDMGPGYIVYI